MNRKNHRLPIFGLQTDNEIIGLELANMTKHKLLDSNLQEKDFGYILRTVYKINWDFEASDQNNRIERQVNLSRNLDQMILEILVTS